MRFKNIKVLFVLICHLILLFTFIATLSAAPGGSSPNSEAKSGILGVLGIEPKLILIQGIGFVIVLLILKKFAFGKIGGVIEDRQNEISSRMDKLESDQAELDRLTAETEQRLNQIEAEAKDKIQRAIEQGESEKQEILEQSRQEAAALIDQARIEIERDKEAAILELRGQIAEIAIDAASRVIDQQLDVTAHQHVVDEYVNRLPTEPIV